MDFPIQDSRMKDRLLLETAREISQLPGIVIMDRYFKLPLTYTNFPYLNDQSDAKIWQSEVDPEQFAPFEQRKIRVFARHVIAVENLDIMSKLPWLLFFQGGPGFESPNVVGRSGWLKIALNHYQVLLLDQRGTGLSSAVTAQTLRPIMDDEEKAKYISYFRTENIVRDAEEIRKLLLLSNREKKWTLLGQSFGGFCSFHYLSKYPEALKAVLVTGGIPPRVSDPDIVYKCLFNRVIEANKRFYEKYPEDVARVHDVCRLIKAQSHIPILPNGGHLTLRRFQQLGLFLGVQGGSEQLHYLLLDAFVDSVARDMAVMELNDDSSEAVENIQSKPKNSAFSYRFVNTFQTILPFETNPIYAILHESIYCQGKASLWSAKRVLQEFYHDVFEYHPDRPFFFTGEMIFDWMFEDYDRLRPLQRAADILAHKQDWPILYDSESLASCTVPIACAVYFDDMYVDFNLSVQMARSVPSAKLWITNDYFHSAIRDNGEEIMEKLISMTSSSSNNVTTSRANL